MTRRTVSLFATIFFFSSLLLFIFIAPLHRQAHAETAVSTPPSPIDDELWQALSEGQPDDTYRILIDLTKAADLSRVTTVAANEIERRQNTINLLKETAVASQAGVIQNLNSLQNKGEVSRYRPLWIVNSIAANATAEAIAALSAQPQVAHIRLDPVVDDLQPDGDDLSQFVLQAVNQAAGSVQANGVTTGSVASWGVDRIRAPYVWHGLGISGNNVVIAIMDSGVDFQHPDLVGNYRGNLGNGAFDHNGNWYNTVATTDTIPIDLFGHGTHVAGTAVGQNGIGVAPGAEWIAVAIADETGLIFESDVHAGFEWIMAPNGDPALAPDIVNCSWGGFGAQALFTEDVKALYHADILPVFSAGNEGPFPGSVGSPASYPDTLAIGASDDIDAVAWFSSRGPSPLTDDLKPWVVAPGTAVLSSLPGNQYGYLNGTSMAAPHVAGTLALMLSANPALTRQQMVNTLAATAVPPSSTYPNNDSGWGRIDAYTAVANQMSSSQLNGRILGNNQPLADAIISLHTPDGASLTFQSDSYGRFQAPLQPGNYTLTVAKFGYTASQMTLTLAANQTAAPDIALTKLPHGSVKGTVRDANNQPLAQAAIQVNDTPIQTTTNNQGQFTLSLPAGSYKLTLSASGYQIKQTNLLVQANQQSQPIFQLTAGRRVLLVDSGQWYYASEADYYHSSLNALSVQHDTWTIRNPYTDIPRLENLKPYDTVVWSAPFDSPGYIGANNVISDYLGIGGNFLISGQDVGARDGYGFDTQPWWYVQLGANYLGKTAVTHTILGADNTSFAGLAFNLNGPQSAANQVTSDVAEPNPNGVTRSGMQYDDGSGAGLLAGACQPYHMVYFGFGLEGVSEPADRAALIQGSFDYFDAPRSQFGVELTGKITDDIAVVDTEMVYTVTVRNWSETLTDTIHLQVTNPSWPTSLVTETVKLGPCSKTDTAVHIRMPPTFANAAQNTLTQITAVSQNNPAIRDAFVLKHTLPKSILFVDDDRFYNRENLYMQALDASGVSYDVWEIGWDDNVRGRPSAALLKQYDFVVWYTGYDWFAPVTAQENQALTQYLAAGGRLFLSGQDFLYYNRNTELVQKYLGVADYYEYVQPTAVYGGDSMALDATLAGPLPLTYDPYQNHADGIRPAASSQPFFWQDRGMPAGTATAGSNWRAILLAFPFETLPRSQQNMVLNRILGWLSDLGDSTFGVDRRTAPTDTARTYTIVLRNVDFGTTNQVQLENPLPAELTIMPATITGDAQYSGATRQLSWSGELASGAVHTITYQATLDNALAAGTAVTNNLTIHYDRHNLTFSRSALTWVNAPDLSQSTLTAVPNQPYFADTVLYKATLRNSGLMPTQQMTTAIHLPLTLEPLTYTLRATSGTPHLQDNHIYWEGELAPEQTVIILMAMARKPRLSTQIYPSALVVNDGVSSTILRENWLTLRPYQTFLPILKQNP